MPDMGEYLIGANGGAYERKELRTGPPLDYVAEKLSLSLEQLHNAWRAIEKGVPEDAPKLSGAFGAGYSVKRDAILSPVYAAFRYELTGFLALTNMLALANEPSLIEQLLAMDSSAFRQWVERVEHEGSVVG